MDKVEFHMEKDAVSNDLKVFIRDNIINAALKELKRSDKSNLAIIEDTIKILENGYTIPLGVIEKGPGVDLGSAMAEAASPLIAKPIPNSIVEGKVVLPDINISNEDLFKSAQENMFKGGMF